MATITIKGQTYSTKRSNLYSSGGIYGTPKYNKIDEEKEVIENEQDLKNLIEAQPQLQAQMTSQPQVVQPESIKEEDKEEMKDLPIQQVQEIEVPQDVIKLIPQELNDEQMDKWLKCLSLAADLYKFELKGQH